MQEFQEQFNKLAESGKKTFGSLLSKVKAKIQEFDQPAPSASNAGVGGDTYPYDAETHPYPQQSQSRQQQQHGQQGQGQPQYQAYQTHAQAQQQAQAQAQMPAYYDPNAPANISPPSSAAAVGYDAGTPAPRALRQAAC